MDLSVCHKIYSFFWIFKPVGLSYPSCEQSYKSDLSSVRGHYLQTEQPISWTKPVWLANTIYFLKERDKVLTGIVNLWPESLLWLVCCFHEDWVEYLLFLYLNLDIEAQ